MQYDAIVLAGGESTSDLKKMAPYDNEALIIIGDYPMIYYVYSALRASSSIRNVVVSGPAEALRTILPQEELLFFVEGGANAIESLENAVKMLRKRGNTEKILALPTDIPFITTEAIEDFLDRCEDNAADFYYPVTSKQDNDRKFPGVVRTYVRLREGIFTGGNLFLIRDEVIDQCLEIGVKLFARRKNPLAMARLFGFRLVWKYITRRLSIELAEKRFNEVLGIMGKGIISPYAEVGVDVDKPSDLELAQNYLSGVSFPL